MRRAVASRSVILSVRGSLGRQRYWLWESVTCPSPMQIVRGFAHKPGDGRVGVVGFGGAAPVV